MMCRPSGRAPASQVSWSARSSSTFGKRVTVLPCTSGSPLESVAKARIAAPWHSAEVTLPQRRGDLAGLIELDGLRVQIRRVLEGEHRALPAGDNIPADEGSRRVSATRRSAASE